MFSRRRRRKDESLPSSARLLVPHGVRKQQKNHCAANSVSTMLDLSIPHHLPPGALAPPSVAAASLAVPGMRRDGAHLSQLVERLNQRGVRLGLSSAAQRASYCKAALLSERGPRAVLRLKALLASGTPAAVIVSKYNHDVPEQRLRHDVASKYTRGRYLHAVCLVGYRDDESVSGGGVFDFVNSHGERCVPVRNATVWRLSAGTTSGLSDTSRLTHSSLSQLGSLRLRRHELLVR